MRAIVRTLLVVVVAIPLLGSPLAEPSSAGEVERLIGPRGGTCAGQLGPCVEVLPIGNDSCPVEACFGGATFLAIYQAGALINAAERPGMDWIWTGCTEGERTYVGGYHEQRIVEVWIWEFWYTHEVSHTLEDFGCGLYR